MTGGARSNAVTDSAEAIAAGEGAEGSAPDDDDDDDDDDDEDEEDDDVCCVDGFDSEVGVEKYDADNDSGPASSVEATAVSAAAAATFLFNKRESGTVA